jgi:hypothetical protein
VYRVHQDERAPVAVEANEAADRRCQREQILFRHLVGYLQIFDNSPSILRSKIGTE